MSNTNLVTNPSLETGVTSWTATNGTLSQDTSVANVMAGTGSASGKVVATAAAVISANYTVAGLTVGQNYVLSFYGKISAASNDFSLVPSIAGNFPHLSVMRTGDNFVRRFVGFVATATSMVVSIQSEVAVAIGDTFWFDRVMVNQGTLLPYFDGSFPYSAWTGTAHASTSTNSALTTALAGNGPTTDEVVLVNGFCLNTLAWNITTKTGRFTIPAVRGDNLTLPNTDGKTFVPNKPIDSGSYVLSMFILGAYPDGTVPFGVAQKAFMVKNYDQILRQCWSNAAPVTIHTWHPSGAVRTAQATLAGSSSIDATITMGGRRAEMTLAFEVLTGVWSDYFSTTVTGTPSAAWSNQTLTLTALSNGTASINDAVVTVTGPITNPIISNAVTGVTVKYTGTVPAGQTWVVDSGAFTSKVNGVSVLSATTHTGHARYVVIDPGNLVSAPTLTLSGSGTTSATNLSVTATRKHLVS